MIKGISPTGKYMYINGGVAGSAYISPGAVGAGMMRWNPNMNCIEVNDGNSWKTLDMGYASVGLSPEAESLLDWAKLKMQEEQEMKHLAQDHPAVKIALENLNKAQEQLQATVILSKDYQTNEEPAS
jgi:hypothetical protein